MRDQVQSRLRLCHISLISSSLLHSFRHRFEAAGSAQNADIEQMDKIIPFITCEIAICQNVSELVFGVNILDLDFWVQVFGIRVSLLDFVL